MLTTIKVYVCFAVKIYKKQTQQIFKRGGAVRCAGPESAFVKLEIILFYFLVSMHDL